jgi:hypothetical protein
LPVFSAARFSTLNVVELLIGLYPESVSETEGNGNNLLHSVPKDVRKDESPINAKEQYICDHYPRFLQMSSDDNYFPLNDYLRREEQLDLKTISTMCEVDRTIITQICQLPGEDQGRLSLHLLLNYYDLISKASIEVDCFRYLLKLYPDTASIKDGKNESSYDIAAKSERNCYPGTYTYFIQLLLNADPTSEPQRWRDLNYAARREAMVLAFRALSSNHNFNLRSESRDLLTHAISYP